MNSCPPANRLPQSPHSYWNRLRDLYAAMDLAYATTAGSVGFQCTGCRDNCCMSRFYHHTYLECLYMLEGVARLSAPRQASVQRAALRSEGRGHRLESEGREVWSMCPLNAEGRCLIYAHRPMICRLHGIPHLHRPPGRPVIVGPGCEEFDRRCAVQDISPLDRTPFYVELARLEGGFRRDMGLDRKIRLTVAGLLLSEEVTALARKWNRCPAEPQP